MAGDWLIVFRVVVLSHGVDLHKKLAVELVIHGGLTVANTLQVGAEMNTAEQGLYCNLYIMHK